MTNTHINVGGHKITTNKVGQVHDITASVQNLSGGSVKYTVINGICHFQVWGCTTSTVGQNKSFTATGVLPKPKINVMTFLNVGSNATLCGNIYCDNPSIGTFYINIWNAGALAFGEGSYPVADDWVES